MSTAFSCHSSAFDALRLSHPVPSIASPSNPFGSKVGCRRSGQKLLDHHNHDRRCDRYLWTCPPPTIKVSIRCCESTPENNHADSSCVRDTHDGLEPTLAGPSPSHFQQAAPAASLSLSTPDAALPEKSLNDETSTAANAAARHAALRFWDTSSDEEAAPVDPGPATASQEAWEGLKSILPPHMIPNILKPGQYLGNEFGAVRKPWDAAHVRFALAYPDLYSIGMSSTGHVVLYSCLNDTPNVLCDRAYLPMPDMQQALESLGKPLFAVESKRPLRDFHIIGMSISYELTATNCLKMMDLAGIPLTAKKRLEGMPPTAPFTQGTPLVFAGGLSVTANPEPYADFFDFISLGDGEIALPAIAEKIAHRLRVDPSTTRVDLLLELARDVPGVYVPQFYEMDPVYGSVYPVRDDVPARPQRQNAQPEPWRAMALVPYVGAVHDRLAVEVRRGCTRGCRFCLPGMVQRPARDVDPEKVVEAVAKGVETTGYNEFSLLSLSCSDWLSLPSVGLRLKNELVDHNISLSLGSQRVDRFDKDIARVQGGLRKSSITFAPEAGTQRMRDVVNKGLTNEDLVRGVKTAYEEGWQNVKLYFMIGLPGETDEDVIAIAETVKHLQRICRLPRRRPLSVHLTISSFTPKPWTPFQWHSVSSAEFVRKQKLLKREFLNCRDVKVSYTDVRLSSMEEFIGRGDRRLSKVIHRAYELGAGMDAWWEAMDKAYDAWCQAIEECGLTWKYRRTENGEWNVMDTPTEAIRGKRGWRDFSKSENLDRKTLHTRVEDGDECYGPAISARDSPLDRPLPWDHIDVGLDKGWLRDELMRALSETLTPDCAFHECSSCGVCGTEFGNNVTVIPPPIPAYSGERMPAEFREQRIQVAFRRRGAMALAGHLDTQRMLDRVVRRAGIPISFTGGFHPRPRIIPATALPFGATSDAELMDFYLSREMELDTFVDKMNGLLPDGLRIVSARNMPVVGSKTSMLTVSAEYLIGVCRDWGMDGGGAGEGRRTDWEGVVSRAMAAEAVCIEKKTKRGSIQERDLRGMLVSLRVAFGEESEAVLSHVGVKDWPVDGAVLAARLKLDNEGGLSPSGLVELLRRSTGDVSIGLVHAHLRWIELREDEKYRRYVEAIGRGDVKAEELDRETCKREDVMRLAEAAAERRLQLQQAHQNASSEIHEVRC